MNELLFFLNLWMRLNTNMLYIIVGFILLVLVLLVVSIFVFKKPKQEVKVEKAKKSKIYTLDELIEVLKKEKKDIKIIENTLAVFVSKFPFPVDENEAKMHFKYVYFYSKNPLPTAKMIVSMQKQLCELHPKHCKSIEAYQMSGVDARKKSS